MSDDRCFGLHIAATQCWGDSAESWRMSWRALPSLDESHDVSLVGFVCVVQRLEDFHFFPWTEPGSIQLFHHEFHDVKLHKHMFIIFHKGGTRTAHSCAQLRTAAHMFLCSIGVGGSALQLFSSYRWSEWSSTPGLSLGTSEPDKTRCSLGTTKGSPSVLVPWLSPPQRSWNPMGHGYGDSLWFIVRCGSEKLPTAAEQRIPKYTKIMSSLFKKQSSDAEFVSNPCFETIPD